MEEEQQVYDWTVYLENVRGDVLAEVDLKATHVSEALVSAAEHDDMREHLENDEYPNGYELAAYRHGTPRDEVKEDPSLCEEAAAWIHPDCDKCGSENVQLLGIYTEDSAGGLYLGIKCLKCGKESQTGDGDFWNYYKLVDGCIEALTDEEIQAKENNNG